MSEALTLTRKQRELLHREAQILEVARRILSEEGYLKLNMDRIAEEIEYAKGTVYQHFKNKEDIIVALNVKMHHKLEELFRKASTFRGHTRDRMAAIGVASNLMNRLYPDSQHIDRVTANPSLLEKATPERQEQLRLSQGACMAVLAEVVEEAISLGDLSLPPGAGPAELAFGLWAMSTGGYEIISLGLPLVDKGIRDPWAALWLNFVKLLDGYGWKPLSSETDYFEIRRRAWSELFSEEYAEFTPAWARINA
ncbi:MAG: TetR/AcrR family transcriptional regulator [Planctomycetota bacterium]